MTKIALLPPPTSPAFLEAASLDAFNQRVLELETNGHLEEAAKLIAYYLEDTQLTPHLKVQLLTLQLLYYLECDCINKAEKVPQQISLLGPDVLRWADLTEALIYIYKAIHPQYEYKSCLELADAILSGIVGSPDEEEGRPLFCAVAYIVSGTIDLDPNMQIYYMDQATRQFQELNRPYLEQHCAIKAAYLGDYFGFYEGGPTYFERVGLAHDAPLLTQFWYYYYRTYACESLSQQCDQNGIWDQTFDTDFMQFKERAITCACTLQEELGYDLSCKRAELQGLKL